MALPPVTIKDIADALGMAHTTVSRALHDHPKIKTETKQRVREMADSLGYVANAGARHMRSGHSKQIGFIVPDIQNEFFNALARSLSELCSRLGYQLSLGISEDDPIREKHYVQLLREHRAEGLIIAPCCNSLPATRTLLTQLPLVQVLRFDPTLGDLAVTADDAGGIQLAVEHLIQHGHTHIAYIGTPLTLSTGVARLRGYHTALETHQIALHPPLTQFGPTLPDFGREAATAILSKHHAVTAFMVASSRQLPGVLHALKAAGRRIPQDVSVISYGDTEWFDLAAPSISAVALGVNEMSDQATKLLFAKLAHHHNDAPDSITMTGQMFTSTLVVRDSIGPAPR